MQIISKIKIQKIVKTTIIKKIEIKRIIQKKTILKIEIQIIDLNIERKIKIQTLILTLIIAMEDKILKMKENLIEIEEAKEEIQIILKEII